MKQIKGLNGDLKPEYKKTTKRTTMGSKDEVGLSFHQWNRTNFPFHYARRLHVYDRVV